jgi:hypothetical protein
MITAEQIPPEVVEVAARALADDALLNWADVPYAHNVMRGEARAAIAAALNAWPNAKTLRDDGRRQTYIVPAIILPLPQQARDE